ncbi:endo alpha-1,4 polygalactosaminidase [Synoicihabitans lomoniglobus]|uniref:Endo alpha-1,4 polygalactosaminidase n=1 Tax=Synoicihabitans lomoniglobus TaxID=2909285 RepID=A0AAF0I6J1_9BACT|nr:endo alpha-1,4 polygalactosaminidase [Opitutaceae bacterium LMO-M01]WED66121.1 endo alpha-1,4 polygalactosaminidase [Opitutaceae bacterium LMO-M01]
MNYRRFSVVFALVFAWWHLGATPTSFYVNYDAQVPVAPLRLHPLSIVHPEAEVDLSAAHAEGNRVLAYLSVGEIAADASYRPEALERGLRLRGKNEIWDSDLIDLSDERWVDLLVDEFARAAVGRGFDGFFLDTLDSVESDGRAGAVALVRRLRQLQPQAMIVANRGFDLLPDLQDVVDGVLVESVFGTFDFNDRRYRPVAANDTAVLVERLHALKSEGYEVFVLDYADPTDEPTARNIASRIGAEGWHALVATPDLRGTVLAPWRDVGRRVFSFYGNLSADPTDRVQWPAESFTGLRLQAALEWLGYEVDYGKVEAGRALPQLGVETVAIILPRAWEYPESEESRVLDWLVAQRESGRRILIFGAVPFQDEAVRRRFFEVFGIGGSGRMIWPVRNLREVVSDPAIMAGAEYQSRGRPIQIPDLQAPRDSHVMRSVVASTPTGEEVRLDALFATGWGGVALDPYLTFQRPDFQELWQFDLFAYLEAVLGRLPGPVPDATTREGRRMLMSHIDGDGFINRSEVEVGHSSAQVVRDHILTQYPIPITVSVVEAEVTGAVKGSSPEAARQFERTARSIFALPNVQVASHSYSHPFMWIANDRNAGLYDRPNLELNVPYPNMDLEREIAGSVDYINRTLAPPDKPVEVFLWSGNCRPPPTALRQVRELGLLAMNGGDTVISRRTPTLNGVAPRTMPWHDELQVFAPAQNENVYTNNWRGPFFGTFIHVIDTFERTESPRRLKPVDIYYHFYSGDYFASLRALETVHDWAMAQPLHAMKVSDYIRIAQDARAVRVYSNAEDSWALVGDGALRSYRVPAAWAPRIDLTASSGITGWSVQGAEAFVHTTGRRVTQLVLAPAEDEPSTRARLESSTGGIEFTDRRARRLHFAVRDLRPVTVVLAGWPSDIELEVEVDDTRSRMRSGVDGRVTLSLPAVAEVRVEAAPAP